MVPDQEYYDEYLRKKIYSGPKTRPLSQTESDEIREMMASYFSHIDKQERSLKNPANFQQLADKLNNYNKSKNNGVENFIKAKYLCEIFNDKDKSTGKSKEKMEIICGGLKYIIDKDTSEQEKEKGEVLEDWRPDSKKTGTPRDCDFYIIPLNGKRFKKLTCCVISQSLYYRFGLKFIGGETFGDNDDIQTFDDNVLIHTGLGSNLNRKCDELFTALYVNGKRAIKNGEKSVDQFTKIIPSEDGYELQIDVDQDNFLIFKINNKMFEKVLVSRKSQMKVYMFSWAEHIPYELLIKNIRIETRSF